MIGNCLCARCRRVDQITGSPESINFPSYWIRRDDGAVFCSVSCADRGIPKPVRSPLAAHFVPHPGTPVLAVAGICDALGGYDRLSEDPVYVAAYEKGLRDRPSIEAFIQQGEDQ